MNNLVSQKNIEACKHANQFIGYFLIGYPDEKTAIDLLKTCETKGVTIFEIGYPSKEAIWDGEVIKSAQQQISADIGSNMEYWEKIRSSVSSPIWVMGYKKELVDTKDYLKLAKSGYIDALVLPDISCGERVKIALETKEYGVDVLGFVNPDMSFKEQEDVFNSYSLIYYQMYTGKTGMNVEIKDYSQMLKNAGNFPQTYIFAGFGISSAPRVKQLLTEGFDGVIVGTEMIKKINESNETLFDFVSDIQNAIKGVNN